MRNNQLVKPSLPEGEVFKITDFRDYSEFSPNLLIGKEISTVQMYISPLVNVSGSSQKAYFVNNRMFTYSSDKYIYEYKNYKFVKLEYSESAPMLIPITFEGAEEILVVNSTESFILDKSQNRCNVPMGSYFAHYDDRLFIAEGDKLYFGDKFDATTSSMDLFNFGSISALYQSGKIMGLATYENDLIVFCQYAIYVLHISADNDFSFTKCNTFMLNIKEKSVAKVGSEIFFMSNKKLYAYKNGKVEFVNPFFEEYLSDSTQMAIAYNDYYAIPFTYNNSKYLYMLNAITKDAHIVSNMTGDPIGGKYFFNKGTRGVHQLSEENPKVLEWISKTMDFGSYKNKVVSEIYVHSTAYAWVYVYSDVGYRCFTINEGKNYIRTKLQGKNFYFSIVPSYKNMSIKDLQIKYRILGD